MRFSNWVCCYHSKHSSISALPHCDLSPFSPSNYFLNILTTPPNSVSEGNLPRMYSTLSLRASVKMLYRTGPILRIWGTSLLTTHQKFMQVFTKTCPQVFPGTEVRWTGLLFPGLLIVFFKGGHNILIFMVYFCILKSCKALLDLLLGELILWN